MFARTFACIIIFILRDRRKGRVVLYSRPPLYLMVPRADKAARARRNERYADALKSFGGNLAVLKNDEMIFFHPYTRLDDLRFNLISCKGLGLDVFDIVVVAHRRFSSRFPRYDSRSP